jgi:ACS family tartrate transporter-like MFS transporter
MKDFTGSYAGGLYGLALFGFIAAVTCAFFLDIQNNAEPVAEPVAAQAD